LAAGFGEEQQQTCPQQQLGEMHRHSEEQHEDRLQQQLVAAVEASQSLTAQTFAVGFGEEQQQTCPQQQLGEMHRHSEEQHEDRLQEQLVPAVGASQSLSAQTFAEGMGEEQQACPQQQLGEIHRHSEEQQKDPLQQQLVIIPRASSTSEEREQKQTTLAQSVITELVWASEEFKYCYASALAALKKTTFHLERASSSSKDFSKQLQKILILYGKGTAPRYVTHDLAKGFEYHFNAQLGIDSSTPEGKVLRTFAKKRVRSFVDYRVREYNKSVGAKLETGGGRVASLLEAAHSYSEQPVSIGTEILSPSIFPNSEEQEDEFQDGATRAVAQTPVFTADAEREYNLAVQNPISEALYPVNVDDKDSPYKELQKFTAAVFAWWDDHFETKDSLALALLQNVPSGRRRGLFLKPGFYIPTGQIVHLAGYFKAPADMDDEEVEYAAQLNEEWCVVPTEGDLWCSANTRPGKQHFRLICCNKGPLRATFSCRGEGGEEIFLKYGGKKSAKVRSISFS